MILFRKPISKFKKIKFNMDMPKVLILFLKMSFYKEIKLEFGLGKEGNPKRFQEKMILFCCIKIL